MEFVIKFKNGRKALWHVVAVEDLSAEIKPLLVNKFKELINHIEDSEDETVPIGSNNVVQFLDDCYLAA